MQTSAEKAKFARPYWNAATQAGTPHATTTFHDQYNKHDYNYLYGRVGEFVRQDGDRGLALGYLSKVRFIRFVSTPLATELTGIDLTKPGQSGEQAARLNVIAREFFALLVQYSLSHPFRDGDYGNVSRSRALPHGSFCIFTGFQEALASKELKALRRAWKDRYKAPPPPPPIPAHIVDPIDDRLEREIYEAFREAFVTSCLPVSAYNASGCCVRHDAPLYRVQQTRRRQRGSEQLFTKTSLVLKGALRKRMRTPALKSFEEIKHAFACLRARNN